jgi:Fic family protein
MKQLPRLPDTAKLLASIPQSRLREALRHHVGPTPGGKYLHYEELKHRQPPKGLTLDTWWACIKLARAQARRDLPLKDAAGRRFGYVLVDPIHEMLHKIDQMGAGRIGLPEEATNADSRDRYLVNSLIEEAITSSQMEGASTTRAVAADMIRSGRKPADRSEKMILNNYLAIEQVRAMVGRPLEPAQVLTLHETLTRETLENEGAAGRLQALDEERVAVVDNRSNRTLYTPPPAAQLPERLSLMCDFANGAHDKDQFIHPAIRAILLHFWLAHDHPFVDGNGRTARALFYWSMLSSGYWLFEYVSISTIIKRSFAQYARAYQFSESDENDATYFIIFHLQAILKAIRELEDYLQRKIEQVRHLESQLRVRSGLNHRQLALLSHAMRHPRAEYTIQSHKRSHRVAYATARADLSQLSELGYLVETWRANKKAYLVAEDLDERIRTGKGNRVAS